MTFGNTRLVAYGIQNEDSDLRVHVSPVTGLAYVFSTEDGKMAIRYGKHRRTQVRTGNIVTAEGYLVPPDDLKSCEAIPIPPDVLKWADYARRADTTRKGNFATWAAKEMIRRKLIRVSVSVEDITDENIQIKGQDIIVTAFCRIQVKYDERAGYKHCGGTGHLFLQVAECNPRQMH